jgi:Dyp-type peroxidase family
MASPPLATQLETTDIQGLVLRGFGTLPEARFLLLQVKPGQAEAARRYLRALADRINKASESPDDLGLEIVLQVAFTAPGLANLEVPESARATFQREFIEGMHDEVRAVSLGDEGDNKPTTWKWGRGEIHALVMVYAKTPDKLEHQLEVERAALDEGFEVLHDKPTITLADQKEHFGWRDGLSLPVIGGVPGDRPRKKHPETWDKPPIEPGEFVLGYGNEYKCLTESPTADADDDPADLLPMTVAGKKDLGKNGTYLVFREMTQDVHGLWEYLTRESREPAVDAPARAIALGAKMVGRWPSGVPLRESPTADVGRPEANKFTYEKDPFGVECPLGSHIRRANPRDVLALDRTRADSIEMVRKHQMIRRGRAFGAPVAESMDPRDILAKPRVEGDGERGLHFICLVGHISRQFEFVQRAWIHSANFAGLFNDGDPLTGTRRMTAPRNDQFTCPAAPVRRRYQGLPPFTRLVGGAYFFLPSITALRFIARAWVVRD